MENALKFQALRLEHVNEAISKTEEFVEKTKTQKSVSVLYLLPGIRSGTMSRLWKDVSDVLKQESDSLDSVNMTM